MGVGLEKMTGTSNATVIDIGDTTLCMCGTPPHGSQRGGQQGDGPTLSAGRNAHDPATFGRPRSTARQSVLHAHAAAPPALSVR
jgi:hypothetical protein